MYNVKPSASQFERQKLTNFKFRAFPPPPWQVFMVPMLSENPVQQQHKESYVGVGWGGLGVVLTSEGKNQQDFYIFWGIIPSDHVFTMCKITPNQNQLWNAIATEM